ncbi:hypothetical protein BU25DRAFT_419942 [Macroventuria anomochaeta]|uniref:Uncharacterized protein n=1 Tax=Macroventuria anomochaeta TaxID=301207 RepID=A0ACB6S5W2_9PLEO|nr:uncharacterized protein BU25DRAFT_419942 [Macroventuria anomochaeta]KAF2629660.1 hypothetical protein BU25DRAFT_419942 [Macroventuria anomochaeta]
MKPRLNLGEVWALLGLARNAMPVCHPRQTEPRPCPSPRNLWLAMTSWCLFDGDKSAKRQAGFWARHRTSQRVMHLPRSIPLATRYFTVWSLRSAQQAEESQNRTATTNPIDVKGVGRQLEVRYWHQGVWCSYHSNYRGSRREHSIGGSKRG